MIHFLTNIEASELQLPKSLVALINRGLWPRDAKSARRQGLGRLFPKTRIQLLAPEQERIYFYPPPFRSVAQRMTGREEAFWSRFGALDGISPGLAIQIGDFGLGSDSPILLDYRQDRTRPTVIRLCWRRPQPNEWVLCAKDFDEFADTLGLDEDPPDS